MPEQVSWDSEETGKLLSQIQSKLFEGAHNVMLSRFSDLIEMNCAAHNCDMPAMQYAGEFFLHKERNRMDVKNPPLCVHPTLLPEIRNILRDRDYLIQQQRKAATFFHLANAKAKSANDFAAYMPSGLSPAIFEVFESDFDSVSEAEVNDFRKLHGPYYESVAVRLVDQLMEPS